MKLPLPSTEEWMPLPDYPGYEVSSLGRVRSFKSQNGRGCFKDTARQLKLLPTPTKQYLRVGLSLAEGVKHVPVHTLVLTAFKGPRPGPTYEVCHNDGDPKNNCLSNLRWGTTQDNANDRINHGTQVRGELVSLAVLTENQVKEIKAAIPNWKKGMGKYFAEKFGVGRSAISSIKQGHTWKHL